MACASACTAAGWRGPTTTTASPPAPARSLATALTHAVALASPASPRRPRPRRGARGRACAMSDRARAQAVIRHHAGAAQHRLGDVEPAHVGARRAALGPLALLREVHRPAAEEVGVERDDHLGLRQIELRLERAAEGEARALVGRVGADRDVPDTSAPWGAARDALLQRRRAAATPIGSTRNASLAPPSALSSSRCLSSVWQNCFQLRAGPRSLISWARAVVVEREDRGLIERRRDALGERVLGVAFDLGRAAFPRGRQDGGGHAAVGERRGVVQRPAGRSRRSA